MPLPFPLRPLVLRFARVHLKAPRCSGPACAQGREREGDQSERANKVPGMDPSLRFLSYPRPLKVR